MEAAAGGSAGVTARVTPTLTVVDLTEDVLSCVLSFLRPGEVRACARVCRRLREVCRQEGKVWVAMCQRRWGSLTSPSRWVHHGHGIPFPLLYATLARWEHLIGFWRGVGNGFLALFDWAPDCIVGHKIVPAGPDSYGVRKIPFMWMGLSEDGQVTCLLDPAFKTIGTSRQRSLSQTESKRNPLSHPCASLNFKAMLAQGMMLVDVHFVGYHHLVIEEVIQQLDCVSNEVAEAATLAAFGSSHYLFEVSPPSGRGGPQSTVLSPYSSSSDTESCIGSPSGSFQHEMYQFLVSKVTSAGGERAARKQRRRGKERAFGRGRNVLDPEHFVKVTHSSPTKARPLQGLWKVAPLPAKSYEAFVFSLELNLVDLDIGIGQGFFNSVGLDFVLVSYDDKEGIVCRKVQDLDGTSKGGSVLWTSESSARAAIQSCLAEEALYNSRMHTRPSSSVIQLRETNEAPFDFCKEVVGIFCTSSCDFHSMFASNFLEGRIWQYANGTFGFGYCHSSLVVDFRALCPEGCLLDAMD